MTASTLTGEVVALNERLAERRIHRTLDTLAAHPEHGRAVNRNRLTLTDFLRSWCQTSPVPSSERVTEWALDWLERRNDQPDNEGASTP